MTRIISGVAGGVRLDVPTSGTRPTSDRVREALFAALESAGAIDGARVLDLYAGSGALGLESLSRGAASAEFVERGRPAASVVRRNITQLTTALRTAGLAVPPTRVHESTAITYLKRGAGTFDLVFSDPPYDIGDEAINADLLALAPLLAPDALVVVERTRRATPPDFAAAGLVEVRDRSYGDTRVWWAEPAVETSPNS